ncbi:hypothetical protein AAH450_18040 [Erwinia sp. P7711]|uniref:hypothetical protein n=1 Tax=Erwinia sp. P7711 TaxID=3141451 RepID=UPI00318B384F
MDIKSTSVNAFPLHQAVEQHDTTTITQLREEGHKTNQLNEANLSPVDLLSRRRSIDQTLREKMHGALLSSMNPTAPKGYTKPEALHGSPWGFEILASGELRGGVNDAKGGTQSLEGEVFFSDRSPEKLSERVTRNNFRSNPRIYSHGKGMHSSNPVARAFQHRMSQAIGHYLASGRPLPSSGNPLKLQANADQQVSEIAAHWLQNLLTSVRNNGAKKFENVQAEESVALLKFPESITINFSDNHQQVFDGQALKPLLADAAKTLQQQLEGGKAPLLAMINNGEIVPMVFGFSKIEDLKTHAINGSLGGEAKHYRYQSESHPLAGSAKGGKLKEIELNTLKDLATLSLTCLAKGVKIPADTLIRINPNRRDKIDSGMRAHYLDPQQLGRFQQQLASTLGEKGVTLSQATLPELQQMNQEIRGKDLAAWVA